MWCAYICPCNVLKQKKKKKKEREWNKVGKKEDVREREKTCQLQCLWGKKESLHIDSIDPALPLDWSVFGWVNSVSRLWREMQSNVMAGCNESFPVGRTVTLWTAGDLKPEGERIGVSSAFFEFRLIITNKTQTIWSYYYLLLWFSIHASTSLLLLRVFVSVSSLTWLCFLSFVLYDVLCDALYDVCIHINV